VPQVGGRAAGAADQTLQSVTSVGH
jgi:hypothetical protein